MPLPLAVFEDLLWMRGESWTWAGKHFMPDAAIKVGRALREHAGGFWHGLPTPRPLGMALVRLLWELGELAMARGAEPGALAEAFRVDGGLNLKLSLATPWFAGEIPVEALDTLLSDALAVGDGALRAVEGATRDSGVHALSHTRMFHLGWREEAPGPGLGYGYTKGDLPDLEIAVFEGNGDPTIYHLGQPWFAGEPWPEGAVRAQLPGCLQGVVPATYDLPGRGRAGRFHIPGTEPGTRIELEGHAFTGGGRLPARARTYQDEAPGLHLHFTYIPGWQGAGAAGVRLMEWSGMSEEKQEFIREWAPFVDVTEAGFGEETGGDGEG